MSRSDGALMSLFRKPFLFDMLNKFSSENWENKSSLLVSLYVLALKAYLNLSEYYCTSALWKETCDIHKIILSHATTILKEFWISDEKHDEIIKHSITCITRSRDLDLNQALCSHYI